MILRLFGAHVGKEVRIDPTARIFIPWNLSIDDWSSVGFDALIYNLGLVSIGSKVTISQRSHLCAGTHDYRDPSMPLIKATISIESCAWICADSLIGPGVVVGEGAIVGARAVAIKPVGPWEIAAGNPAHFVKFRPKFEAPTLPVPGKDQ